MPGFTVRSRIPGRTRFELIALMDNRLLADHFERVLRARQGVLLIQANPKTGRVLLLYQETMDAQQVEQWLAEALSSFAGDTVEGRPAPPPREGAEPSKKDSPLSVPMLVSAPLALGALAAVHPLLGLAGASFVGVALYRAARNWWRKTAQDSSGALVATRRLSEELQPHTRALVLAGVCGALTVGASLARYSIIGAVLDLFTGGKLPRGRALILKLAGLGGLSLLTSAIQALLEYVGQRLWRDTSRAIQHRLRLRAYSRTQSASMQYLEGRSRGELASVLTQDIHRLEQLLSSGWELVQLVSNTAALSLALFAVAPPIAWLAMVGIPTTLLAVVRLQRLMEPKYSALAEQSGRLSARVTTNLDGIETIKAFVAESLEFEHIRRHSRAYSERTNETDTVAAAFGPTFEITVSTGIVSTLVGGGLLAGKRFSMGTYSTLLMLTRQLLWPFTQLGRHMENIEHGLASLQRVYALIDAPAEDSETGKPLARAQVQGRIEYSDLAFTYPSGTRLFRGLSLRVREGRTTAIIGPTGSGKSSLIRLLLRFYEPEGGQVTLDGVDIRQLRLKDLRSHIGVVSQEVFLFSGTVRENIALGNPSASMEDIVRAATLAEAHSFIERLPQGYDTEVGERGSRLSGGERQRLSIARLLLKASPIVVLDEATSHLDNRTEARLYKSLRTELKDRTMLVIAHRLSAARHADHIYVLEEGCLREEGNHWELLERNGLYASLWRLQAHEEEQ